jgi:hypothetical protein
LQLTELSMVSQKRRGGYVRIARTSICIPLDHRKQKG